jgi:hypothetical protein
MNMKNKIQPICQISEPLISKDTESQSLFTIQDLNSMVEQAGHQLNDVGIVSWCNEELNDQ